MRIPDSVKVGSFVYAVERPEIIGRGNRELVGEADHDAFVIKVERGLRPDKAEEVFLHELIHCVDVFMKVGLDEDQVTRLSNGLYMVLKENGLLNDGEPDGEAVEVARASDGKVVSLEAWRAKRASSPKVRRTA